MKRFLIGYLLCFWLVLFLTGCGGGETLPKEPAGKTEEITGLRVTCIDVGKGDCILLQSSGHTLLLDTGYEQTAGQVTDYLKTLGVRKIDELVITHFDKDHEGGVAGILSEFGVGKIYLPDYEKDGENYRKMIAAVQKSGVPTEAVSETVSFEADGVKIGIESSGIAYDAVEENDNDLSLLLKAEYKEDSYLFTGDIEKKAIKAFLEREQDVHYDVLKLPHHGDGNKKTDELLDSVTPELVLITDGTGQPAEDEVCELLTERGIDYYTSLHNGTIVIEGDGSGTYRVSTER